MEKTLRHNEKLLRDTGLSGFLECAAVGIALAAGIALCAASLFHMTRISPERYVPLETILIEENELTNLVLLVVSVAGLRLIGCLRISERFANRFSLCVLGILALLGLFYVTGTRKILRHDGGLVLRFAEQIALGEANLFADELPFGYISACPHQLGILTVFTGGVKLFGTEGFILFARILNVLLTVGAYGVLLWIVKAYTDKPYVRVLTALLMLVLIQPILACTFVYGQIPAFALGVFAMGAIIKYLNCGKKRWAILMGVLLSIAVWLKQNTWIVIAAIGIVLILDAIRRKRLRSLFALAFVMALTIPVQGVTQTVYERKYDVSFGSGLPFTHYVAEGVSESYLGPGWFNQDCRDRVWNARVDGEGAMHEAAMAIIGERIEYFRSDPDATKDFYIEKFTSQWNEPTFQSIWDTKFNGETEDMSAFARFLWSDRFDEPYRFAENLYLQLLYGAFVIGLLALLRRRTAERLLLPVTILGGVLFHLISEVQAIYALSYLPLFCPVAAFGIGAIPIDKIVPGIIKGRTP